MPETRFIEEYKNGVVISRIPYEVSDEQLTDEADVQALAKVDDLIDQIDSLIKAKVFLKQLCKRLIRKGYLP